MLAKNEIYVYYKIRTKKAAKIFKTRMMNPNESEALQDKELMLRTKGHNSRLL
jgi:hypothetical protein